jgi:hypothetical protein
LKLSEEARGVVTEAQAASTEQGQHQHDLTTIHLLEQKDGVPYELEQVRCADCHEVVDEAKRRVVA